MRTRGDHRFFHAKLSCGLKAEVLRGVEEEERWGSSILGWEWASRMCKGRRKQLGVRPGPTGRILRLRGNMDGAVKLLKAWKLRSERESNGAPRKSKDLWARTNWCGWRRSRGSRWMGRRQLGRQDGRLAEFGERQAVRGGGESAVVWSKGSREPWSRNEVHADARTKRGNSYKEVWELERIGPERKKSNGRNSMQWR